MLNDFYKNTTKSGIILLIITLISYISKLSLANHSLINCNISNIY